MNPEIYSIGKPPNTPVRRGDQVSPITNTVRRSAMKPTSSYTPRALPLASSPFTAKSVASERPVDLMGDPMSSASMDEENDDIPKTLFQTASTPLSNECDLNQMDESMEPLDEQADVFQEEQEDVLQEQGQEDVLEKQDHAADVLQEQEQVIEEQMAEAIDANEVQMDDSEDQECNEHDETVEMGRFLVLMK